MKWTTPALMIISILTGGNSVFGESVTLAWIAPGDDGYIGTAAVYDLRWASFLIDNATWQYATRVEGEPVPRRAGSVEIMTIDGLPQQQWHYFALKTADEAGNWSKLSRVVVHGVCLVGCLGTRGNVDSDINDRVNLADLTYMVAYLFLNGQPPLCPLEANVDGDSKEKLNIADLQYLVCYLYSVCGTTVLPPCL
ncbi:MAG TPA: hypothetical protein VN285_07860 [Candidatus Deferrimicrobium sp.]|nr:hypothetical protein [Candidatus Deferrimicrobium sp.]